MNGLESYKVNTFAASDTDQPADVHYGRDTAGRCVDVGGRFEFEGVQDVLAIGGKSDYSDLPVNCF